MKRMSVKQKIKKWLGIGLATAVIASGLTVVTPSAALAVETPESEIPTSVTLEIQSSTTTEVTLKATTNKALELSTSTLSLFKIGDALPANTATTGTVNSFTVPRPTTGAYSQYNVTVAGLTSNSITVHSNVTGTWQLSITSNVNSFKTQDASPTITWTTNKNVKDTANTGIYITEKSSGAVLCKASNVNMSGSSPISKFFVEPHKEYIAYIADWTNTANSSLNASNLTNIKTVSNSIFIYRIPWTVNLTTDRQTFSTDDATPKLTWEINQQIGNATNNIYSVYIVNVNTGAILNRIDSVAGFSYTYSITRFIYEPSIAYKAVVANKNTTITNSSQFANIQAESNIITITRAAWTLSLSTNSDYYLESSPKPILTWTTNQKVQTGTTDYKVYIANKNTGAIFYTSHNKFLTARSSSEIAVPNFLQADEFNEYVAYIARYSAVTPTNVSELVDIQATSNILPIERFSWNVEASVDKNIYATNDSTPIISWSSNQNVSSPYGVYVVDEGNKIVARTLVSPNAQSGTLTPQRENIGGAKEYKVYIAQSSVSTPKNFSELTNIQSVSNPVNVTRAPWGVTITIDNPVFKTDDERPTIFWTTNQPVGTPNSSYAYYLADVSTGQIVDYKTGYEVPGATGSPSNGEGRIPRFYSGGEHEFKAYIARAESSNTRPTTIAGLQDIQAESNSVFAIRYPWEISLGITRTIFSTDDPTPKTTWSTNQSVRDANGAYEVYVIQVETGKIISSSRGLIQHRTGQPEIERFYTGGPRTYQAYVAAGSSTATNITDLQDIQATSNIVGTQRAQWGVALKYEVKGVDETLNKKRVEVDWFTNQTLSNTNNNYQMYIFNNSTGALMHTRDFGSTGKLSFTVNIDSKETFIAYVAKKKSNVTNVSQLEDIVAESTAIFPEETSITVKEAEYEGGGNPSMSDCNQQCYGDPVNSYNGEFFENTTDLTINSLVPFNFTRSYSTWRKDENRGLGKGWQHNYDMSLEGDNTTLASSQYIKIHQENGSIVTFAKIISNTGTYYIGSNNIRAKFSYDSTSSKYIFERDNGYSFVFGSTGKLEQLKDRNNNALNLTYTSGKLTQIAATTGQTLTITWTGSNITSISDGTRAVTYTYSSNLLSIVDIPETTGHKQYTYDTTDRVKRIIQTNGGYYENFYDTANRVTKQVNPLGGETLFSYQTPTSGNVTTITLPDSTQNREKYNRLGQLIEQKLAYGSSLEKTFTYEYDFTGQKSKETGPSGILGQYTHDNNGNITSVKDSLNRVTHFTYNSFNQVVTTTDALGKVTTNTYDEHGNLLITETPEGNITEFENNSDGTTNTITSPNDVANETGKKTTFGYDNNKYLTSITQPEGAVTTVTNNAIGNPLSIQSPLNKVTQYIYNSNQQVTETITPNLENSTVEYDNAGQVIKTTDSLGRETTYTYDLMGNVLTTTGVYGTTSYEYGNMQQLIKMTETDGAETEYEYNTIGQPIKITDALGNESTMTYYNHGLIQSTTDALGNTTSYEYDAVGNTIKVTDDNNNFSTAIYDALNRVTSSTSANGYTETYAFDDDGNLISSTKAGLETTTYEYDANGNLTKTIHPDSSSDEKTYDSDDQLTSFKDRDGKITSYIYDDEGKVTKTVRSDLSEIQYSYTNLGQLDQISYDNWATIDTDYNYDVHGRVTSETKNGAVSTYAYDSIGNMTRRGPPTGAGVEYSYDPHGTIKGITYPSGLEIEYSYDLNGNLTTVEADSEEIVSYTYNPVGNLTRADYGNGTYEVNSYDNLNRLTTISLNNSNGEFYKKQLELDNVGLIISDSTTVNSTVTKDNDYSYTSIQRLENVTNTLNSTTKTYQYNSSSNLTSSPWGTNTVTANGQLTTSAQSAKTVAYTHDDRGNRTNKTVTNPTTPNNSESINYQWTTDDKLNEFEKTVTEVNGSTTEENKTTVDYSYDANGLLTSRQATNSSTNYVNNAPVSGASSTTPAEKFVWDTLATIPALLEDKTDSFVYGNGSSPFAQINKTTGDIEYLHGDERGSIIAASLENGNYSWYQTYDEYGYENSKIAQPGVNQISTRFAYAGEYQDPTTGLYNLRARWYEPETASFLTVDPALGMTGEAYSYASANPLSYTDPLGLWSQSDTNATAGFIDGVIGLPVASSFMNWLSPGSVQLCSTAYANANLIGNIASFFIPGGWGLKVVAVTVGVAYGAFKVAKAIKPLIIGVRQAKHVDEFTRLSKIADNYPGLPHANTFVAGGARNGAIGNKFSDDIAAQIPGSLREVWAKRDLGANNLAAGAERKIDVYDPANGIAHEAKAGSKWSRKMEQELDNDVQLRADGLIKDVIWHFTVSPITGKSALNARMVQELQNRNVRYIEWG